MSRCMSTMRASPFSANNTAQGPTPRVRCVCAVVYYIVLECVPSAVWGAVLAVSVGHICVSCGVCQRRCWGMLCCCVCVFLCTCCVCVAMQVPGVPAVYGCYTWCPGVACQSQATVHVLLLCTLQLGIGVHVACVPSSPRPPGHHSGLCPVRCAKLYHRVLLGACAGWVCVCAAARVRSHCPLTARWNGTV